MDKWIDYFINRGDSQLDAELKAKELIDTATVTYEIAKEAGCDNSFEEWCEIIGTINDSYFYQTRLSSKELGEKFSESIKIITKRLKECE